MIDEFTKQDIPFFNYDIYDLLYMGYGDTVPDNRLPRRGHDVREEQRRPDPGPGARAVRRIWTSLDALAGRKDSVLKGWAASYRQAYNEGVRGKLEPNAVFAPGSVLEQEVPEREDPQLLHPALQGQGSRGAEPHPPAAADGRRGAGADQAVAGARLPRSTAPSETRSTRLPAGHVLHADGAGAEALGPGDARRGQLRAVPVLLRRDGVEWPAAQQHRRRPLGRACCIRVPSRAPAAGAAKSPGQGAQQARRRRLAARSRQHLGLRVRGLDALPVRRQVEAARTPASPATRSAADRSTTSTCW